MDRDSARNDEADTASGGAPEPDHGDVAGTEDADGTPTENPSGG